MTNNTHVSVKYNLNTVSCLIQKFITVTDSLIDEQFPNLSDVPVI